MSNCRISGWFVVKSTVPAAAVEQAVAAVRQDWSGSQVGVTLEATTGKTILTFDVAGDMSNSLRLVIEGTFKSWAKRFADWQQDVMHLTSYYAGKTQHMLFGPENRCIEVKLSMIDKRIEDLQEEWTDLNYTQLARASSECVDFLDRKEGA